MTNKEIRVRSRKYLQGNYFTFFGISIGIGLISFIISFALQLIFKIDQQYMMTHIGNFILKGGKTISDLFADTHSPLLVLELVAMGLIHYGLMSLFLLGRDFAFLKLSREDTEKVYLYCAFTSFNIYSLSYVIKLTLRFIIVALGYLAFIFPGIILKYTYQPMTYLLYDRPNLGIIESLKITRQGLEKKKFDLFKLSLFYNFWIGLLGFALPSILLIFIEQSLNKLGILGISAIFLSQQFLIFRIFLRKKLSQAIFYRENLRPIYLSHGVARDGRKYDFSMVFNKKPFKS